MRWVRLVPGRLQSARIVAVSWTTIHDNAASLMAHVSVLGMDMAQQMFPVVGMDDTGTVVLRKRCPWVP